MKKFLFCLSLFVCVLFFSSGTALGAIHNIQVDPIGFYPSYLEIEDGDSIRFYNYTGYPLLTIYHDSGPCWPWMIDVPNNGNTIITLPCGAGTEVFRDNVYGYSGTLEIVVPSPTPTPDPNLPVSSPVGIGLMLLVISMIMGISVVRKK